jgi:hypothetical protein
MMSPAISLLLDWVEEKKVRVTDFCWPLEPGRMLTMLLIAAGSVVYLYLDRIHVWLKGDKQDTTRDTEGLRVVSMRDRMT